MSKKKNRKKKNKASKVVDINVNTPNTDIVECCDGDIVVDVIMPDTSKNDIVMEREVSPIALGPAQPVEQPVAKQLTVVVEKPKSESAPIEATAKAIEPKPEPEPVKATETTKVVEANEPAAEPVDNDTKTAPNPDDCIVWRINGSYVIKSEVAGSNVTAQAEWVCKSAEAAKEMKAKLIEAANGFSCRFDKIHNKRKGLFNFNKIGA